MNKKQVGPDGEWVPVHQEIGGRVLLPGAFSFTKLFIKGNTYTVLSDKVDEGFISIHGEKLDIYNTDGVNNGRHLTAIYQIEAGKLKICYNLKGDSYPKAFTTDNQPSLFLSVFEKVI